MIIGVTGTNGSGKGTVVAYLAEKSFKHYSARDFIVAEIECRGLPVDRDSMRKIANDLRKMHGPEYVIRSLYTQAERAGGNAGLESIRTIGEVEFLRSKHAFLLAIDAEKKLRYERVVARGSATDKVDFDTWVAQEEREWNNSAAYDMNVPAVMAMADYTIRNNGTLEELYAQIEVALVKMK